MKSGSISGELTAMDADNAFAGCIANMLFDLEFMLIENDYKSEQTIRTTALRSARPSVCLSALARLGWPRACGPGTIKFRS